jgi:purine-nucleoside phosphorylase
MILIHTALLCEAQTFIEYYKLKKINSLPKIYANDDIIVCISGIKSQSTLSSLNYLYENYSITKAFNIGIAGCNNINIKIGNLYCTNRRLKEIERLPLITSNEVITSSTAMATSLHDMEGEYFHQVSKKHLKEENIYIFKIVSDHLSSEILKKDYIKLLISKQKIIHDFIKLT